MSKTKSLVIFGDSFSTNVSDDSWVVKVGKALDIPVVQYSQNGVSEYRILKQITAVNEDDIVIVCHTNPLRIYLPDDVKYPARKSPSHPHCDLVVSDAWQYFKWRWLARMFVKYFFDEKERTDIYNLIRKEIASLVPNAIHISGFDIPNVISIHDVFLAHRGKINHMTPEGNDLVAKLILEKINVQPD